MRPRMITAAAIVAGLLAGSGDSALAAPRPHHPAPQKLKCPKGYKKKTKLVRRRGHKLRVSHCVKKKVKATTPRATTLHAHLDPTYSRDPDNPFRVRFDYSASATVSNGASDAPAPLPEGVLAFYLDGKLECAENVGNAINSSVCPVTLEKLGAHQVRTIFSSGSTSATAAETVVIDPLPTSTQLQTSYTDLPPHEEIIPVAGRRFHIGTLSLNGTSLPVSLYPPSLDCRTQFFEPPLPNCVQPLAPLVGGQAEVPVYARFGSFGEDGLPTYEVGVPPADSSEINWEPTAEVESGVQFLRAVASLKNGYTTSEGRAPYEFSPQSFPGTWLVPEKTAPTNAQFQLFETVGTYDKLSDASGPFHIHSSLEAGNGYEGCLFQWRVNGQTAAGGDSGVEAGIAAVGKENNGDFGQLAAGPVSLELWYRYEEVNSQNLPNCHIHAGFVVASE